MNLSCFFLLGLFFYFVSFVLALSILLLLQRIVFIFNIFFLFFSFIEEEQPKYDGALAERWAHKSSCNRSKTDNNNSIVIKLTKDSPPMIQQAQKILWVKGKRKINKRTFNFFSFLCFVNHFLVFFYFFFALHWSVLYIQSVD